MQTLYHKLLSLRYSKHTSTIHEAKKEKEKPGLGISFGAHMKGNS
jgi:hypothetical protein